jgi:predicted PurR-regulated permease PerM
MANSEYPDDSNALPADHAPEDPDCKPHSQFVFRYFLILFLISILLIARVLWPFVSILILSFILVGIFKPIYSFLNRYFSPAFSSLSTCFLIIAVVFIPLLFFVGALSKEVFGLYQLGKAVNFDLGLKLKELLQNSILLTRIQEVLAGFGFSLEPDGFNESLAKFTRMVGLFLYNQASSWAANIMNFVISFFMMIIIIFFLLIDNERLVNYVLRLSPLPDNQERKLIRKFEDIAGAVLIGNGICGLIQGFLGGITFAFMGLGSPILWGGIMVVLAFLPIFGIGMVLIPSALLLFLKGKAGAAFFMLIFYALLSFSVEYALKPKLVGRQVKIHTLLVFLSILGGLSVFGVLGIIYGPLIVTAFLSLSDIYLETYDRFIKTGEWDCSDGG